MTVEIRAINNRFFKLSVRTPEGYASLEPLVEGEVRGAIHRGTIQVNLRVDRKRSPEDYRINVDVLERYQQQLWRCCANGTPRTRERSVAGGPVAVAGRGRTTPRARPPTPRPIGRSSSARCKPPWKTWAGCAVKRDAPWPPTWRPIAERPPPVSIRSSAGRPGGRRLPEPAFRPAQETLAELNVALDPPT